MNTLAEEAARIVDTLPAEKAQALLEYARYLAEKADEEVWRSQFDNPNYATKLTRMAEEALAEYRAGQTQPLEPDKL